MTKYTAFLLDEEQRNQLLKLIRPQYPKTLAHHVTHEIAVENCDHIPSSAKVEITGIADDHNGVQALTVRVNGETDRPDGCLYHITWSIDPRKTVPEEWNEADPSAGWHYKAQHANQLVSDALTNPDTPYSYMKLPDPIIVKNKSVFINSDVLPIEITEKPRDSRTQASAISAQKPSI